MLRRLKSLAATVFRRSRFDREMDEEMQFHVEERADHLVRKGMDRKMALRQARLEFGAMEAHKEECRETRGVRWLESLTQDLRFAFRSFRRNRGFTATVLVTLALGIGVGTAVFAVVNAILLQPLPYKDPDRLVYLERVSLQESIESESSDFRGVSSGDCSAWRDQSGLFESVACILPVMGALDLRFSYGDSVDVGFCKTVGVQPLLGRCFAPDDYRPVSSESPSRAILLQYSFWKNQLGGDPEIIGRTFAAGANPMFGFVATVIGVMPPEFVFRDLQTSWFQPYFRMPQFNSNPHRFFNMRALGRLKPGLTLGQAQAAADVFSRRMAEMYPDTHEGWRYFLSPASEEASGGLGGPLRLLLSASAIVLLIVCLNVAGLVLVRSLGRSSEIAVRSAIGAGRVRLIRQLITENALLSFGGGILGLGLACVLVDYLRLWIPSTYWTSEVLRANDIRVDSWVIAFAAVVAAASAILFGLFPAFRGTSIRLAASINEGSTRGLGGSRARRARHWLSVAQVSMAAVLTVSACLLVRSFVKLHQQGAGFRPENIVTLPVSLGNLERNTSLERVRMIYERFREELAAIPGVEAVAIAGGNRLLSVGGGTTTSYLPIRQDGSPAVLRMAFRESADGGYFQTLGIPLIKGRVFDQRDRPDTARVAIVNQEAARQFWPGEDPIGRTLIQEQQGEIEEPGMTVVGVIGDVRERGLSKAPQPVVYQPTAQARLFEAFFLKTARDPGVLYPEIIARLRAVYPDAIPFPAHYGRLDRVMRDSTWQLNYSMLLLAGLAGLALLVSAVGVYGVLSYTVRQRTREIGLRMALGAERSQVVRMFLRQGLAIAVPGVVVGLVGAAALTRFLASLLYGVEPLDPVTFAFVGAVMLAAALLASYLPAAKAAKIDPTAALRCE